MTQRKRACLFVVDDDTVIVDSICGQFTFCGFEVIKATEPKRVLELSDQIRPDIIVADIRMPKLDGISLIKKFKAVQPSVKVILMTGYYPEYEDVIKEAISSGLADKIIQKRFHALDLERMVYELLKSPEAERRFSAQAKAKVLFVDDEVEVLDFLRDFFRENGFAVSCARSAEDALAAYKTFEPDVVVTDIKMPDRDGFWLIEELKRKNVAVRIVVITGHDDHQMLNQFKEAGIREYFTKPFSLQDLEHLAQRILEKPKDEKGHHSG